MLLPPGVTGFMTHITINFKLKLNDSKSIKVLFVSALEYCHKLHDVFEFLSYFSKLEIDITSSRSFALSMCVLVIKIMKSVNNAEFLNLICVLSLSGASFAFEATILFPLTSIFLL